MADLTPAFVGIVGVAIGGAIQWIAATRAQRVQFILKVNEQREAFYTRALRAADNLRLVHAEDDRAVNTVFREWTRSGTTDAKLDQRTEDAQARFEQASGEWREVLTTRYLSTSPDVSSALVSLNEAHEELTASWEGGWAADASDLFEGDFKRNQRRLRAAVQLAVAQNNATAMRSMTHIWHVRVRLALRLGVKGARDRLKEIDSETVAGT